VSGSSEVRARRERPPISAWCRYSRRSDIGFLEQCWAENYFSVHSSALSLDPGFPHALHSRRSQSRPAH
jgi:hypothetical protein